MFIGDALWKETMSYFDAATPVTETSNPLTLDIDISSSAELIDLLYHCDRQIFEGWDNYKSNTVFSEELIFNLQKVSEEVLAIFRKRDPNSACVVFSGCGTSGRIGFRTAKAINSLLKNIDYRPSCDYIIAGGDRALLMSQESPEDSPQAGVKALEQLCNKKKKVLFIGITCGLSAPFVAGQLLYCLQHLDVFTPVLLGFNPVEQARNTPIEGWNETFLSVVKHLMDCYPKGYIINPILGPEAITGSSRMKGGTTTKFLLEIIMLNAVRQLQCSMVPDNPPGRVSSSVDSVSSSVDSMSSSVDSVSSSVSRVSSWVDSLSSSVGSISPSVSSVSSSVDSMTRIKHLMQMYETVWRETYPQAVKEGLAEVIDWAGLSLNASGHVYYIGLDPIGLLGLIDASECPPTFGADVNDVRCFISNGYKALDNREGNLAKKTMESEQKTVQIKQAMWPSKDPPNIDSMQIGAMYFMSAVVPSLTLFDTVIFLVSTPTKTGPLLKILAEMVQVRCSQVAVFVCHRDTGIEQEDEMARYFSKIVRIRIPVTQHIRSFLEDEADEPSWFDLLGVHAVRQFAAEMSCKLLLNAVSTGAHIKKGKVFHNLMVDLKLSNNKLFQRGLEIVKSLAGCSEDAALTAILRSLYGTNEVLQELKQMPVSEHVKIGAFKPKVIPTALILASRVCLIHEAMEILLKYPVVRAAVGQLWSLSDCTVPYLGL